MRFHGLLYCGVGNPFFNVEISSKAWKILSWGLSKDLKKTLKSFRIIATLL